MIGSLLSGLFNLMLNLISTIIQIIVFPLNAIITGLLPDVSQSITSTVNGFTQLFSHLGWAINLLPETFIDILLVILTIRLAVMFIGNNTRRLINVWNVLQKIKFW